MNDPRVIVAQDWTNPTTRKLIQLYPEIPHDGVIREIWHAQKWHKNMDLDILSPMYAAGATHYYVNEVACLNNGNFVIPIRWGEASIADQKPIFICANDLKDNYYDLAAAHKLPKWEATAIEAGHPARMPNPKRVIAAGRPLYSSLVDYFSDDVSGNKSKSWNKHWNAYMTHRNLPRKLLQQEFHVHFISTSPNASVSEQFYEFKQAVEETHSSPVIVEDEAGNTTCFSIYAGKATVFVANVESVERKNSRPQTKDIMHFLRPVYPRTKEFILQELRKQVKLACSGVLKPIKDLQTETGVKDPYTQFYIDELLSRFKEMKKDPNLTVRDIESQLTQWTVDNQDKIYSPFLTLKGAQFFLSFVFSANGLLGFDPTKDTPIELLHTILLGVVKYIWHVSHTSWSPEQKQTYALRLQSTDTDGLSIHAIRANYIMQYAGSLIGRQFKTIAQTNLFHVRDLVTKDQFKAWRAAGELAALLWFEQEDLKVAVANVLDIFGTVDPSKIVSKVKYHLLVHTDEDVVEFGPLVGVITEIFESFNADSTIPARIADILVDSNGTVLVILEVFQVLSSRDEKYGVPVLVRRNSEEMFYIVPGKNVKFKFNVQHDCESAKCDFSGAFHNAHLLRATLPRDLLAPVLLFPDRQQKHHELAEQLWGMRATRLANRRAAAGKRKRSEEDDGKDEGRPKPKKKRSAPARPRAATAVLEGFMVANRDKRTIKRTRKALATPQGSDEDTVADSSDESEIEGEEVDSSDGDYHSE
ncbi:hypothetical protein MSAN_02027200 [Mycena sanguinolenta]|uniref:Uncharacterized protein n=1 Tax=Mycena sanguinolenta TaxID=230812 RepID=A0A8H6XJG5_9AGAR|nr:hypothetical protein MSAN_02027200 [Mycena sanguinolenta]